MAQCAPQPECMDKCMTDNSILFPNFMGDSKCADCCDNVATMKTCVNAGCAGSDLTEAMDYVAMAEMSASCICPEGSPDDCVQFPCLTECEGKTGMDFTFQTPSKMPMCADWQEVGLPKSRPRRRFCF